MRSGDQGWRILDLSTPPDVLDALAIAVRDGVIVAMATAREIDASFRRGGSFRRY